VQTSVFVWIITAEDFKDHSDVLIMKYSYLLSINVAISCRLIDPVCKSTREEKNVLSENVVYTFSGEVC
jgi:hypothetical protein